MNVKFEVSKTIGQSFVKYKGDALRLSLQTPAKVDEIVLKSKTNPNLQRKITTFRDSNGELIERAFEYSDKPYRNRLYSRIHNTIGNDEFVTSTTTQDYLLDRDALTYYKDLLEFPRTKRTILWSKIKTETNHLSENIETGEKILSQTKITPQGQKHKLKHTFIEYSHIKNGKIENSSPKLLTFSVKSKDYSIVKNSMRSSGVNLPTEDSYLGYRALSINDSKEPFANHYIRERGLEGKGITVDPEYNPINEENSNFKAIFNVDNGRINFNKDNNFKSKSDVAGTSAHEAEHGWQFYLQALLTGGDTPWQEDVANSFGKLKDAELIKEAKEYDEAIENYVPFWKDRNAYRNNLIEVKAKQKGFCEENNYDREGLSIRTSFRHIPKELL